MTEQLNGVNSHLKRNIIANYIGAGWQAVVGLIFIPVYIRYLGIESWGLIGVFATIQVIFGLLDMGLSSTMNRELARMSALTGKEQEMRNLVRTLEIIYWGVALFVGIIIVVLSPVITDHWLNAEKLSGCTIKDSLNAMGFVIAFQMPIGFYSGGLLGLQKQVRLNIINIMMSTLRALGAVAVLAFLSRTIEAYFIWQIVISALTAFLVGTFLWRSLPESESKAVFQFSILKNIWRFAAGVSGITILAVILTQLDKIILSRTLALDKFGYYMLASTVALTIGRIVSPVFLSIYPKFTQLVSMKDEKSLTELYHKSSQFIAILVFPVAAVLGLFSFKIILIWTKDPLIAENTHKILSILICGTALNGLMFAPYALQLAHGWTKLSFYKNLIAVFILVPVIYYSAVNYGPIATACVWTVLNIGYVLFEIPIMHTRLLKNEMWHWYARSLIVPISSSMVLPCIGLLFVKSTTSSIFTIVCLAFILLIAFIITFLSAPAVRSMLLNLILKIKIIRKVQEEIFY